MSFKFEGMGMIGGNDAKRLLKKLLSESGDDSENRLVKKSVPAKPEWIKMHDELEALVEQTKELLEKIESGGKKWWATIELDLDDFSTDKRYNGTTKEMEILADRSDKAKKDEPIKSPFQKGEL